MSIETAHFAVRQELNHLDSSKYSKMNVPQIDWYLNLAQRTLAKRLAVPRTRPGGIEFDQRITDELKAIMVNAKDPLTPEKVADDRFELTLPKDYWWHAGSMSVIERNTCKKTAENIPVDHAEFTKTSTFNRSSFQWQEVNIRFAGNRIILETDGTFDVTGVYLWYLRKPKYAHYADGSPSGRYILPDSSTPLTGKQNLELSELQDEIVSLAVALISNDIKDEAQASKFDRARISD